LLSLATVAFGKPYVAPVDYLVNHSDLIVVGTLGEVSRRPGLRAAHERGIIAVSEALWGPAKPGDRLRLDWDYQYFIAESCNRLEFGWAKGEPGIWFLTIDKLGRVRADNLGRFLSFENSPGLLERVRKRIETGVGLPGRNLRPVPGEPLRLFLVFRNPSAGTRLFPVVEYREQRLYLDPRFRIEVRRLDLVSGKPADPLIPKPGSVRSNDQTSSFQLAAGEERKVLFDIAALFDLKPGQCYSARLRVDGVDDGAEGRFCVPHQVVAFSSNAGDASPRVPIK
jgi:hypothetical protein